MYEPASDAGMGDDAPEADPFRLPVLPGGELEGVLRASKVPVVVDFFATWCGPCAWIVPTLRSLVEMHGPRIRVFKIDVDEAPDLATRHRIASVPTIVVFRGSGETSRSVGVEPERVREMVDAAVQATAE